MTLTLSRVQELRKLMEGITPLPWTADEYDMYIFARGTTDTGFDTVVADDGNHRGDGKDPNVVARMRGFGGGEPQERNLHAIAAAMNILPDLLEIAERSLQPDPLREFGRDVLRWVHDDHYEFFANEMSEEILPLSQAHGFTEYVEWNSAKHGESDEFEDGDMVNIFTDAMLAAIGTPTNPEEER